MKNRFFRIFLIGVLVLALVPVVLWMMWFITPAKPLNVFILDKTVPTKKRTEHESLVWVLNHNRFCKEDNKSYNPNEDYYGFFPININDKHFDFKRIRVSEINQLANEFDMLYFADTYGVFYHEWYKKSKSSYSSQRIYGGLNNNDYLLLQEMVQKNKLVITEFNLLASPTTGLIQSKTEDLLGIEWSGWTVRYFKSLDTTRNSSLPQWLIDQYQTENNGKWPFRNAGLVYIHNDDLFIMEEGVHLQSAKPIIKVDSAFAEKYGMAYETSYSHWFDIIDAGSNYTFANYHLQLTDEGSKLLTNYRLPAVFPAVVGDSSSYRKFYFAGDFSDVPVNSKRAHLVKYSSFASLYYSFSDNELQKFYWNFYYPMVKGIIEDYYEDIKED